MLIIQDKIVKLGGIELEGQIKKIEIQSAAAIDEIQDDKGTIKSTQPTGYEASKIMIDIIFEDKPDKTTLQQIQDIRRLFQAEGQTEAKLLEIVNEDCAAHGISMVYFKNFTTSHAIAESQRLATMELCTPMSVKITTTSTSKSASSTANKGSNKSASQSNKSSSNSKSTKNTANSPVKDEKKETGIKNKALEAARKIKEGLR